MALHHQARLTLRDVLSTLSQTPALRFPTAVDRPEVSKEYRACPRVLHVLDHSWPVLSGYSVRSRNLISSQHGLGCPVSAVTSPLHQLDDPDAQDTTLDGVPYRRTSSNKGIAKVALEKRWPALREYSVVRLLRQQILAIAAREHVELIHAHSPALCGLAALQAARAANLPCVYEIRAFWEDAADPDRGRKVRSSLTHRLETYVAQNVDAVAAIATPMLADLQMRGIPPGKLFHTPNGVDTRRFLPQPKDEVLARQLRLGQGLVFGFFGSLYRYEGLSWLMPGLARLRARGASLELLIIGKGEDAETIRQFVRACDAGDYVHMLDHVPHEEIGRYYSVVDVAVYPRRSLRLTELVTPLKPLEAMAQGKAVLASAVGGIRELVEHERTGLLFQPEHTDDFCHQATRLIASPPLRQQLGNGGRDFVVRERDWSVLAHKYLEIYSFALSCHNRASKRASV